MGGKKKFSSAGKTGWTQLADRPFWFNCMDFKENYPLAPKAYCKDHPGRSIFFT
jgi:hypothetical protein